MGIAYRMCGIDDAFSSPDIEWAICLMDGRPLAGRRHLQVAESKKEYNGAREPNIEELVDFIDGTTGSKGSKGNSSSSSTNRNKKKRDQQKRRSLVHEADCSIGAGGSGGGGGRRSSNEDCSDDLLFNNAFTHGSGGDTGMSASQ